MTGTATATVDTMFRPTACRPALPIYIVFLLTIGFTIYFPTVVLWLPKHVIPESVGCFKSPSGAGYICP